MKLLLEDGTEFEGYAFGADRRVTRAPWYADLPSLASRVDGVLIGNGPGDPQDLGELVAQVRLLFKRRTNEGTRARCKPIFSIQFHPEACPDPRDTAFLFDEFLRLRDSARRGCR